MYIPLSQKIFPLYLHFPSIFPPISRLLGFPNLRSSPGSHYRSPTIASCQMAALTRRMRRFWGLPYGKLPNKILSQWTRNFQLIKSILNISQHKSVRRCRKRFREEMRWISWTIMKNIEKPKIKGHARNCQLVVYQFLVGGLEHFLFFHILGIIVPTDSYFSEGFKPPTRFGWLPRIGWWKKHTGAEGKNPWILLLKPIQAEAASGNQSRFRPVHFSGDICNMIYNDIRIYSYIHSIYIYICTILSSYIPACDDDLNSTCEGGQHQADSEHLKSYCKERVVPW